MTNLNVVSREAWLAARLRLLEREKALTRQKDEISKARRSLPWVKVERDYLFETSTGPKNLAGLFGPRGQLVVYHFMFGRDWERACKSCSFWADSFEGLAPHLAAQDIAFLAVSSAPLGRIETFKRRMGWTFEWVSSHDNEFNDDFDVGFDGRRDAWKSRAYNYGALPQAPASEMPGISVFAKDDAGDVYHTYSTYGRGLDVTNAAYAYIDLTPRGRHEPEGNTMAWVRYHDEY